MMSIIGKSSTPYGRATLPELPAVDDALLFLLKAAFFLG